MLHNSHPAVYLIVICIRHLKQYLSLFSQKGLPFCFHITQMYTQSQSTTGLRLHEQAHRASCLITSKLCIAMICCLLHGPEIGNPCSQNASPSIWTSAARCSWQYRILAYFWIIEVLRLFGLQLYQDVWFGKISLGMYYFTRVSNIITIDAGLVRCNDNGAQTATLSTMVGGKRSSIPYFIVSYVGTTTAFRVIKSKSNPLVICNLYN